MANLPKKNNEILSSTVRLIDEEGNMIGIVNLRDALEKAKNAGLDLVEVSPNAEPPVCKILDFGKHKYEAKKKAHDARKKQKIQETKEIKLRQNIGDHDYKVKKDSIVRFISEGNKVKITLRFKGREITHAEIGMKLFERLKEEISEFAKVEYEPKLEGNKSILMILAPKV
ncbi:MAG: translation initiation factor IF-3 [Alphaproteobacteria bacterium]